MSGEKKCCQSKRVGARLRPTSHNGKDQRRLTREQARAVPQPPQLQDFHCGECGVTTHKRPVGWVHNCCTGDSSAEIKYQKKRAVECRFCPHNKDGVCEEFKKLRPSDDYPGRVEVGIKTPYAECPIGKWGQVSMRCPSCESVIFDVDGPTRCRYCGWDKKVWKWKGQQQSSMDEHCIAVTALSELPHHQERQAVCLDSWKAFGLSVVAVNQPHEVASLRGQYPQVSEWVGKTQESGFYERETTRIVDLIRVARKLNHPVLLINSDIEIYGDQSQIIDPLRQGKQVAGIRWNYPKTKTGCPDYQAATRELWGLDAFSFTPDQAETYPELPLAIGRPFWDYWIPTHAKAHGHEMQFIGERMFFHARHKLHWSEHDWHIGRDVVAKEYGVDYDKNAASFRRSLPFPPPRKKSLGERS